MAAQRCGSRNLSEFRYTLHQRLAGRRSAYSKQGSYLRALSVEQRPEIYNVEPERPTRLYCVVIYTVTSRILQQVHPKRFHWLVMGKSCSLCELRHRQFVGGQMRSLPTCVICFTREFGRNEELVQSQKLLIF